MIAETRSKLLAAGRKAFADIGYADASMDDFTAKAGLTRGALYHHFGDKRGLFLAVVMQIDAEMTTRLKERAAKASSRWEGFVEEGLGYIEMALEPEIRRIILQDGPAVLGDPAAWPTANGCVTAMMDSLTMLESEGTIEGIDVEATARMITGASCYMASWIAHAEDPDKVSKQAMAAYRRLLEGLLPSHGGSIQGGDDTGLG